LKKELHLLDKLKPKYNMKAGAANYYFPKKLLDCSFEQHTAMHTILYIVFFLYLHNVLVLSVTITCLTHSYEVKAEGKQFFL